MTGTPTSRSGQRREDQVVGQRRDLDEGEPLAPVQSRAAVQPARRRKAAYSRRYVHEAGALVALDVEAADPDAGQLALGRFAGARRPRTTTGRPDATTASASRRTRGSSS